MATVAEWNATFDRELKRLESERNAPPQADARVNSQLGLGPAPKTIEEWARRTAEQLNHDREELAVGRMTVEEFDRKW